MTDTLRAALDDLRGFIEAATNKGNWRIRRGQGPDRFQPHGYRYVLFGPTEAAADGAGTDNLAPADAALIVAAVNYVRAALQGDADAPVGQAWGAMLEDIMGLWGTGEPDLDDVLETLSEHRPFILADAPVGGLDVEAGAHVLMRAGVAHSNERAARLLAAQVLLTAQAGQRYDLDDEYLTPEQRRRLAAATSSATTPMEDGAIDWRLIADAIESAGHQALADSDAVWFRHEVAAIRSSDVLPARYREGKG